MDLWERGGSRTVSKEYPLSFVGSSIRRAETLIAARLYLENRDWNETYRAIIDENLFDLDAESSRKRVGSEIVKRTKALTDDEIKFLVTSYGDDQLAMLWVSACRTYPFVRRVSEELIVGRYERSASDYTPGAYEVFFENEAEIQPELAELSATTKKKVANQVFRMLVECRLVSEEGEITPLHPTPLFRKALDDDHKGDWFLFPGVTR